MTPKEGRSEVEKKEGRIKQLGFGSIPYKSFVYATKTTTQKVLQSWENLHEIVKELCNRSAKLNVPLDEVYLYSAKIRETK